jgi:hypothetical protein
MRAGKLWPTETTFVEIGARADLVGELLIAAGFDRYLGVARSEAERTRLIGADGSLAARLAVCRDRRVVRHNNAEVLVLHGSAAASTIRFRNLRHAAYVAFPWRIDVGLIVVCVACLYHALLRRLDAPRWVRVESNGRSARLLVFRVRRRTLPRSARHYIPHQLGLEEFLRRLTGQGIRHAVLRWFESLPGLAEGEDLDILVDDDDLPRVLEMLDAWPGIVPCDVYSETGLPRSDFRKMPYYPPRLAGQLLAGAVVHRNLCRVPNPEHHFLSLAYHAIYHKGPPSGIPTRSGRRRTINGWEHDYAQILSDLAARRQWNVEITREGLEEYLSAHDWRPPRDMLARLGQRNRWIRQSLDAESHDAADRGLVVFIVRREAMNRGGLARLVPLLERSGFSVLTTKVLADEELAHVAANIRGGNWGRGPWGTSGGPPAAALVAYDPHPTPLTRRQRKKFPLADNARLLEKSRLRDALNEGYPRQQHCNVLHSSDNSLEAWEYIAIAMPADEAPIRRTLAEWKSSFRTDAPVLQELTRYGVRAKIELVECQARRAVRKTFKPGRERFCRREVWAMRELSRIVPEIPPLLEEDENWVIYPYYDDVLQYQRSSGRLIPLAAARAAIAALRHVYEAGYALVDASIDNIVVDRREGLKLIDFEFLHRYHRRPESFRLSYDIAGCPENFADDLPAGGGKNYRTHWMPYTGLSLDSLLNDPPWLQHAKRTLYVAIRPYRYLPRRIRHVYRLAAATARRRFGRGPQLAHPTISAEPRVVTAGDAKRAA